MECKLTDTFQGTFHEKVLRIPGCVVNAVADLDLSRDNWRGENVFGQADGQGTWKGLL